MCKLTAGRNIFAMGAFAVASVLSCAHEVKPDSMSAEAHEQQARTDTAQAHAEVERAMRDAPASPNPSVMPSNNPEGYLYPVDTYDPASDHLARARQLEEHAREHRAAAAKLEAFTANECHGFPPETRAACPMLGPVKQIYDINGGVRVVFTPKTRVQAVAAHMRCHLAYAQQYGFEMVEDCPLYLKGLQIQVSPDGKAIELISHEPKTIDAIRSRTREEAILVRQ